MSEKITTEHYFHAGLIVIERYTRYLEQISDFNQEIIKDLKDISSKLPEKQNDRK